MDRRAAPRGRHGGTLLLADWQREVTDWNVAQLEEGADAEEEESPEVAAAYREAAAAEETHELLQGLFDGWADDSAGTAERLRAMARPSVEHAELDWAPIATSLAAAQRTCPW